MSDSGFSGLPPGTRGGDISFPQSRSELKAKIIEIRGEIKTRQVRTKMEGEIIRHNEDGTTSIRTDKGDITVQLRGREIPPEGAKVEIEIPPSNPPGIEPKQVTVRPAPQQAQQELASTPVHTTQPTYIDTPITTNITREIITPPTEPLPQNQQPKELQPETIIRLTPLPPQQVQQITQPVFELTETKITTLPPQIQALVENKLPRILFEQTEQLILISVATKDVKPIIQEQTEKSGEPPKALQTITLSDSSRHVFGQISELPHHDTPHNDEEQKTLLPLQQPNLLSITLPSETALSQNPFQALSPINKAQSFNVNIQTIISPQVTLSSIQTQPLTTTSTASTIPQQHAGSITGTITGITPQNLPVISIFTAGTGTETARETVQNFVMPFQAGNVTLGTQIQMTPQAGSPASFQAKTTITTATPAAPFIPLEFFSNFQWPALEELNQALQQASPQSAQAFSNTTANAASTARIPAALLFFIAAIRSGDISGWLGDKNIDALRRAGKSDLLSRLSRDISGLQKTSTEPLSQDWRGTALPIMAEGDIHKMMLYYRHDDGGEENDEDTRRGTRFIFDLNLNRLGEVQIDGLHRPGRLNLIVRTHSALSQPMQKNMRRTYINALEQTELTGELSFQNKPEQFIKIELPKEDIAVSA